MTSAHTHRPPDDLRELSVWFDKGFTHFLCGLNAGDKLASAYPVRDTHDEEQEADFIAGYHAARKQHEAAKGGETIGIDGHFGWRVGS